MKSRARHFGRGCTLVAIGSAASLYSLITATDQWGHVIALVYALVLLYPGFTLLGLALISEDSPT